MHRQMKQMYVSALLHVTLLYSLHGMVRQAIPALVMHVTSACNDDSLMQAIVRKYRCWVGRVCAAVTEHLAEQEYVFCLAATCCVGLCCFVRL
jgi:hypothetical protein